MHSFTLKSMAGPSLLGLGLCVALAAITGCDPQSSDELEERAANVGVVEQHELDELADEPIEHAEHDHDDHDDCGLSSYQSPVEIRWVAEPGTLPELEIDFAAVYGPEDTVEVQFMATPMPAGDVGFVRYGDPVSVREDGRLPMPDDLVAAVRSGNAYAAFALLEACGTDDVHRGEPHGNCVFRSSNELYIEDGLTFMPDAYQVHLRDKWSATKPWLFEHGVVTNVVDMKGR